MGGAARLLCIAVLTGAAAGSSNGEPPFMVRDVPVVVSGTYAAWERTPRGSSPPYSSEDGPPTGGPSRSELMELPDAVPKAEPMSPFGNPPAYLVNGRLYRTLRTSRGYVERGIASWYGSKFHKRPTSSREPYDMFAMTAAHRNLPLPTYVRVTHLGNGRSVVVRINDRGPFHPGRIIDLSYAAAAKLDILDPGSGPVEIRAIRTGAKDRDGPPHDVAPIPIRLYVQIGAYLDETNARRALALAARVRPGRASITRFAKEGREFHRVRIGPLSGPEEADRVIAGLDSAGMGGARVVIESRNEETAEHDDA